MNFRNRLQSILVLLLFSSLSLADDLDILNSVAVSWEAHRSTVSTARIQYFSTLIDCDDFNLNVDDVQQIVADLEFAPTTEFMQKFVQEFNPDVVTRHLQHEPSIGPWDLWNEVTLWEDGLNIRSQGKRREHLVANGLHLLYSKQLSQQISAFDQGRCVYYYYDRDWFLGLPSIRVLNDIQNIQHTDGTLLLESDQSGVWTLDAETQLPQSQLSMDDQQQYGRISWNLLPTSYPGDVTIPMFRVEVNFREGIAQKAEVTAITSAEFNVDIPQSTFVLPAKEGVVMVDERSDQRIARQLDHDVENSAEYFLASGISHRGSFDDAQKWNQEEFDWKAFFLIANGICLIVLGGVLWRRSNT